ncbi:hypothetical protein IscW_ISCW003856, partial [Ixodes scapularis]
MTNPGPVSACLGAHWRPRLIGVSRARGCFGSVGWSRGDSAKWDRKLGLGRGALSAGRLSGERDPRPAHRPQLAVCVEVQSLPFCGDSGGVVARPAQNGRAGRPGPSRTSRGDPMVDVAATSERVKTALAKLVDGGFQESLEWLLSSLEDAVEDWDSEDATSTPLVPLAEAHHSSMEDGEFCSLLRSIGVTPPVDEQ